MYKKEKSFWKNPWVIAIGSSVIAYLIIKLIDVFFNTSILSDLIKFLIDIILWIYQLFTMEFSTNILVLLLIFLGTFFLIKIFKGLFRRKNLDTKYSPNDGLTKKIDTPNFLNYVEDKFKALFYRWEWYKGSDGKYRINNIYPLCPKCKCKLVGSHCPNCEISYYGLDLSDQEVEALVHHKIDNNTFPTI